MQYMLDTTAFSDLMRQHPRLDARLGALSDSDRVTICVIVRGEILHGIRRLPEGARRRSLQAKAESLFKAFSCEPVPVLAGDEYARTKLGRQQKGLSLDENDLWIAASAVALGCTLVARDQHFRGIEGLPVEDWTG